ncbi:hypothetical protein ATANTOWER_015244 [Ataeniobius toweri]|uniref:Uncharacterized protein n=1 Tax=Ataeniobius toweri TaxID=208326 RepID=A0ABU7AAI8_9TELE|nr:hypothetical protein [Ataeniobius toweri]
MMEGFSDLLTDAFSESSVPSFSMGDLDFENLCFDEKSAEEQAENLMTETDEAQLQEASAEGAALFEGPTADTLSIDENAYEDEEFKGVSFRSKTPEDDSTSSDGEEEQKVVSSGTDEDEKAESSEEEGDALTSISSSGDVLDSKKEDEILDDEDSEALEDVDELKVSNKLQEEVDSDEEETLECRNETIVKHVESEGEEQEREEDSSESEYEGMKIEEENVLSEEPENPYPVDPGDSSSKFPSLSFQNLQDLISEVDGEAYQEKMSDFTGEEHQEAGESFADYPSDFSSSEYGRNPVNVQGASPCPREEECLEKAVTETLWTHMSEEADYEKEEEFLFSRDIEMNADKMMSLDEAPGEEDERKSENLLSVTHFDNEEEISKSDSYSSSEDEEPLRRSSDVFSIQSRTQDLEDDRKLENITFHDDSTIRHDRYELADFLRSELDVLENNTFLSEYLLTTDDTEETESPPSDKNQCLEDDANSYSVVQREDTKTSSPFIQGSIDDSFFFNNEPENFTEDGQRGEEEEDEYEERRSFEQMKQRIEAFQKFYDTSDDENGRERQTKVQFCADPLSQVNYYDTDSSDRDSLSSSSGREEDPSSSEQSDEPREPEEDLNIKPVYDPAIVQQHQIPADIINTQTCTETPKSLSTLKLIVMLGVLTATGVLMFCLTTDQPEWLRQLLFF